MTAWRLAIVVIAIIVCVPSRTAHAQPSINPVVPSVTGTNAEPVIFHEVNLSPFELLTGAIQFKEDAESAKAVFAPFKLMENYVPSVSEFGINLAQKKGVTTLGLGTAYSSKYPTSAAAQKVLQELLAKIPTFRSQMPGESQVEYDLLYNAYYEEQWAKIYDGFYKSLARNLWVIAGAWNSMSFGLGSDPIDADEDGEIDNTFRWKGHDLSLSLTYTLSQATGVTVSGHFGKRRQDAKQNSEMADYDGWSVAVAQRVKILNPNYPRSADYLKSLFIPAILIGASVESERCDGSAATCENRLSRRLAITPWVEFKITPEAQFRIGVPATRSAVFGGKSKTLLGAAMQYVLQLKGTK
jgi:hypothetical protein